MKWSPAVRELLAAHEMFRKLGFLSRDLYVDLRTSDCQPPCSGVHVQFTLRYGDCHAPPVFRIDINEDCSNVFEEWPEATKWWNTATVEELAEVYENSDIVQNKVALLMALSARGLINEAPKEVV